MSFQVVCDRCGKTANPPNKEHLPTGWEKVAGADLCEKCGEEFHEFLRNPPVRYVGGSPR
jgi:hypothetical protein